MGTKLGHLKEKAIFLRLEGYSYGYIQKELQLKSKGTISYWLKDLVLPKSSKRKLAKNTRLATERGLSLFNLQRSKKIKEENKQAHNQGFKLIPKNFNTNDLLLIGTALYWAEGTKTGGESNAPHFSFSNSDPEMIKLCLRFLREVLLIDEQKIRAGIHLYPSTNILKAKNFWSKITDLSSEKFYIITQISRASKGLKGNKLPYGTIHIRVNNRIVFFKMKGLIDGMINILHK